MMNNNEWNRRDILGAMAGLGLTGAGSAQAAPSAMPRRTLGRTGQQVFCIGLGGSHIGKPKVDEQSAIRIVRAALDRGMNFMDNSWDYKQGQSEIRMGKALQDGYRQKAFLMTKFDGRTKDSATQRIDERLKCLQTDHLDLLQFQETIRFDDPDRFFTPGGAAEALVADRKAGKTSYIGFTGHKDPHIHL
jgi:aryl-alcohol dehydrogenase-like predicted oxidoreductase